MRRCLPILAAVIAVTSGAQSGPSVFRRDLLAGSWKVNWEKSKMQHAVPASRRPAMYREYRDNGDGFMLHTVMQVSPGGEVATLQLLGAVKYDNKEYPTFTQERLTNFLASGKQPLQTVAFKVTGSHNLEWTDRTSGRVTADGTMTLSEDGRIMTMTDRSYDAQGKPVAFNVLIYDKQ